VAGPCTSRPVLWTPSAHLEDPRTVGPTGREAGPSELTPSAGGAGPGGAAWASPGQFCDVPRAVAPLGEEPRGRPPRSRAVAATSQRARGPAASLLRTDAADWRRAPRLAAASHLGRTRPRGEEPRGWPRRASPSRRGGVARSHEGSRVGPWAKAATWRRSLRPAGLMPPKRRGSLARSPKAGRVGQ
jgi:hypothetical protein